MGKHSCASIPQSFTVNCFSKGITLPLRHNAHNLLLPYSTRPDYLQLYTIHNHQHKKHLTTSIRCMIRGTKTSNFRSLHYNNYQFLTSWSAKSSTVLREKRREQKLKRSSSDGPNSSITMTLQSPSEPHHLIVGIPTEKYYKRKKLVLLIKQEHVSGTMLKHIGYRNSQH